MSHLIFTLFLAKTMDDSAILKAGNTPSESSEEAVVRKVLRASSDASSRAVLWLSFKHQQHTFTT